MSDPELLREALVDLERAHAQEKELREESDALLEGLRALAGPGEPDAVFRRLLDVWRGVVNTLDAFVLVPDVDGRFRPVASTNRVFEETEWQPGALFQRVLSGAPAAVFDVAEIEEWRQQPASVLSRVKSALHVRLSGPKTSAILIGTHKQHGKFGRRQVRIARRFVPLASQALVRRETEAALRLNESRLQALVQLGHLEDIEPEQILKLTLREAVSLSKSQVGFLALIPTNAAELNTICYRCAPGLPAGAMVPMTVPLDRLGRWYEAVREGSPLVDNACDSGSAPFPDPDVRVRRILSAPVVEGDSVVAVAGVGNKPEPYDAADAQQLTLLLRGAWYIVQKRRAERSHRELQSRLEEAQRMEAVGRLAGGVAHEINNVLATINALASVLQFELNCDHEHTSDLENIVAACQRGAELTSNLLGFARKGKYTKETLSINEIVSTVLASPSPIASSKRALVKTSLVANPPCVVGDGNQLRQVVTNLIANACDAVQADGSVIVTTTEVERLPDELRVSFSDVPEGPFVAVHVADDGVGMDEATASRAFEPFFTTKPVGQGTGLGLSMVYGTVRNHRGAIRLSSKVGQGTTASIWLPVHTAEAVSVPRRSSVPEQLAKSVAVLVVEDEDGVRRGVTRLLQKMGLRALTAVDGVDGLRKFKEHQDDIGLVVLDLMMPNMNGEQTFFALREISPRIRVLILSGFAREGTAADLLAAGALGYVQKPFDVKVLRTAIRDALSRVPRS